MSITLLAPAAVLPSSAIAPRWNLLASRWACLLILIPVCGVFCFYGLNAGELYRNEGLRAILAQGMLRTGNWIVPTLYDEPLLTKPPGMYIAIALCSWPFGAVAEWTARLPSALAATATVLLMFWYISRHLGPRAGLLAGLLVPMTPFWLDKSITAEIDMLQVAWVTAAILCFLRGAEASMLDPSRTRCVQLRWLLAALICVAGGTLTKWTAPLFFYATAVPLLWWRKRLRVLWSWQHFLAAFAGAMIVLSWIMAVVWHVGWDLLWTTVSREAVQHLAPGQSPKPYSWAEVWQHPFRIFAATLPWSPLALLMLRPSFMKRLAPRSLFLVQALHCWVWPSLVFWTFATEHSVRHSAPLFPGLLGLAAIGLISLFDPGSLTVGDGVPALSRPLSLGLRKLLIAALALWMFVKVVYVEAIVPHRLAKRQTRDKAASLALHVPLGKILYLFRLKDEGIMFYYARAVVRRHDPSELPNSCETVYCILTAEEWRNWNGPPAEVVEHLHDAQGDAIVLVQIRPTVSSSHP